MSECGFPTDFLARLGEVVSGQPFDLFLQQRILEPLGMTDTGFRVVAAKLNRLAKVYEHGTNGELQPVKHFKFEVIEGQMKFLMSGSDLFSTIGYYSRSAPILRNRST